MGTNARIDLIGLFQGEKLFVVLIRMSWKEDQFRFQKFGIVLRGSQLFKQIQESCLQCQHRMMRPIPVHMGLANRCMFQDIRIFKFISVDLKGPFVISTGKSIYALVMICLQTKISEIVLLDSRTSTAILEGFNVVFSFYSTPIRITADKESGGDGVSKLESET